MDRSNYKNVLHHAKTASERDKVHFLLDHLYPNLQKEVPDPYYGSQEGFDEVFYLVEKAVNQLLKDLSHG